MQTKIVVSVVFFKLRNLRSHNGVWVCACVSCHFTSLPLLHPTRPACLLLVNIARASCSLVADCLFRSRPLTHDTRFKKVQVRRTWRIRLHILVKKIDTRWILPKNRKNLFHDEMFRMFFEVNSPVWLDYENSLELHCNILVLIFTMHFHFKCVVLFTLMMLLHCFIGTYNTRYISLFSEIHTEDCKRPHKMCCDWKRQLFQDRKLCFEIFTFSRYPLRRWTRRAFAVKGH